jgi:hypothetical protein
MAFLTLAATAQAVAGSGMEGTGEAAMMRRRSQESRVNRAPGIGRLLPTVAVAEPVLAVAVAARTPTAAVAAVAASAVVLVAPDVVAPVQAGPMRRQFQ